MRHLKFRFDDDLVAEQNEIEIERPRRTAIRPLAAEVVLDLEQCLEQQWCVERCGADSDGVEIERLVGEDLARSTDGIGFNRVRKRDVEEET